MHHYQPQPHIPAVSSTLIGGVSTIDSDIKRGKKRGSYNCGRCGQPKKGHVCHVKPATTVTATTPTDSSSPSVSTAISAPTSFSSVRQPPTRQPFSLLRRALSFDDVDDCHGEFDSPESDNDEFEDPLMELEPNLDPCGLPGKCLWDILKRLPPTGLLSAAMVCKGWRETTRRLWKEAEELRLRVPAKAQVGFVASILQKCPGLVRLSLRMERLGFLF